MPGHMQYTSAFSSLLKVAVSVIVYYDDTEKCISYVSQICIEVVRMRETAYMIDYFTNYQCVRSESP